jgi:hypothetical protein
MNTKQRLARLAASELTKDLVDRGMLIEAGFVAFRHLAMDKDAPPLQIEEMRLAWMAGAEHLFSSVMTMLDPGEEPTATDLRRMDQVASEIETWRKKLEARVR